MAQSKFPWPGQRCGVRYVVLLPRVRQRLLSINLEEFVDYRLASVLEAASVLLPEEATIPEKLEDSPSATGVLPHD